MEKHDVIFQGFKGTVVNRAMLYLLRGLLKYTLTVPLTILETPKISCFKTRFFVLILK